MVSLEAKATFHNSKRPVNIRKRVMSILVFALHGDGVVAGGVP